MPKALIWGESLVGSGHARVQSELARKLQEKGWEVSVITSSKAHTDHFDFGKANMIYQPQLKLKTPESDPYKIANLVTPDGKSLSTDMEYRKQRKEKLLNVYYDIRPDAIITEMWPYARANFDFELIPLAEAIKNDENRDLTPAPRLYSIARDIMFPPKISSPDSPGLNNDRHTIAYKYFKAGSIFARADKSIISLEASIGAIPEHLYQNIEYVGYFGYRPRQKDPDIRDETREVLVSSGGGVTRDSITLYKKSIAARKFSSFKNRIWRILIPHGCSTETLMEISSLASAEDSGGRIIVEHNRTDFPDLLSNAALLICHGGNMIVEAVSANIPLLVVPRQFAKNNLEQQIRARAFYDKGLTELATISEIDDPVYLAEKLDSAAKLPRSVFSVEHEGADRVAERITQHFIDKNKFMPLPGSLQPMKPVNWKQSNGLIIYKYKTVKKGRIGFGR
ncbi:glycosyltransferase [Candidatus Methylospira mobilis]|nr:glycosyltransferase [Candidatus Methylospira mobilis]WNV04392.1 glycosyltransferase [Candidatus Methylospira mobilis]